MPGMGAYGMGGGMPMGGMSPAPPNGPCCHGFYPLKEAGDGKMERQSAEEVYADKLVSLSDMGFSDKEANIKALIQARGDVSEAVDILTKEGKK